MKGKILGGLFTIILSCVVIVIYIASKPTGIPIEAYQVYLNGEKIGVIESKDELYDLIDNEQIAIKEKYGVDKVYPPNGLDVEKIYSYDSELVDVNDIYDNIKDKEPFTIAGYNVTITYTTDKIINDSEVLVDRKPVHLYMLDKSIVKEALYNTVSVFIDEEELKKFEEGTQEEIEETGSIITSVYFNEKITIKEDLISTEDYIFGDVEELSRYLLYGTLETQKVYTAKLGDNLDSIASNNSMNIRELLIVNPSITSADVLITEGDKINVGLINPLVDVVYHKTIVEDVSVAYKTEYVDDNTKFTDYKVTTQEGSNGLSRITQEVAYTNGEISSLTISKREVLQEVVNKVITRGTKSFGGSYYYENTAGNDEWSWPTLSPFVITDRFAWRWGKMHNGVDISGTGYGSPIFAIQSGTVYSVSYDAYASPGLSVIIDHGNGYYSWYMHMSKILVTTGQKVSREERIGLMGSTGYSTGTHLHIGVLYGGPPGKGTYLNPCTTIFSC